MAIATITKTKSVHPTGQYEQTSVDRVRAAADIRPGGALMSAFIEAAVDAITLAAFLSALLICAAILTGAA